MDDLLRQYLEALGNKRYPEYSTIKSMLRILNSADKDDSVGRVLNEHCQRRYDLLDGIFQSHKDLALRRERDLIQEERRLDLRNNRDWYNSKGKDKVSIGEFRTTVLISAVEIIYYLIYKSKVDVKKFPNLLAMEPSHVFAFAKLISSFTDDFKILEIYLDNSNSRDKLLDEMIKYYGTILFQRDRYTRAEKKNLKKLIVESINKEFVDKQVHLFKSFFGDDDFILWGNLKTVMSSMLVVGLVCRYSALREKIGLSDLSWLTKNVDGVPFILAITQRIVECGNYGMKDDEFSRQCSGNNGYENSLKALVLILPILKYAINSELESSKTELTAQIDKIFTDDHKRFLDSFKQSHLESYQKLEKYLNSLRS